MAARAALRSPRAAARISTAVAAASLSVLPESPLPPPPLQRLLPPMGNTLVGKTSANSANVTATAMTEPSTTRVDHDDVATDCEPRDGVWETVSEPVDVPPFATSALRRLDTIPDHVNPMMNAQNHARLHRSQDVADDQHATSCADTEWPSANFWLLMHK